MLENALTPPTLLEMAMLRQFRAESSYFPTNWWDNQSMTTRQVLIVGGIVGLLVSSAVSRGRVFRVLRSTMVVRTGSARAMF